jgi:DNA-binding NtrC family response regulator
VNETLTTESLQAVPGAATDASNLPLLFPTESRWTLRDLSRAYTEWVLARTGGNKERAAEILGIDLSTLYRWLRAQQDN